MLDSLMVVVMCRAQDAPWAQGISLLKEWWTTGRPGVVSARLEIGSPEGIGGGSSGHVDVAPASLTMGDASGGAGSSLAASAPKHYNTTSSFYLLLSVLSMAILGVGHAEPPRVVGDCKLGPVISPPGSILF